MIITTNEPWRATLAHRAGCGDDYRGDRDSTDWLNVDLADRNVITDLDHDLNETPWPFPDNCFAHACMDNVIEHLDDQLTTLRELARIVEPGGTVEVSGPHWHSAGQAIDPTHTTPADPRTFDHYLVSDLFTVETIELEKVRWARVFSDSAALWLADIIGQGVAGWTVTAVVN